MKKYSSFLSLVPALFLSAPGLAWSANQACMIEGSFKLGAQTIAVKDCMEYTVAIPADQLKSACEGLAQASAGIGGGKAGKVTYSAQCPRPASGACMGLMGQPMNAYYYNLSGDAAKEKRQACEMSSGPIKGGTWNNGQ